ATTRRPGLTPGVNTRAVLTKAASGAMAGTLPCADRPSVFRAGLAMLSPAGTKPAASRSTRDARMQEGLEYAVLHEFVTLAKRNVTQGTWDYIVGGAETETTQERNRIALDSIAFRPRVLRDVEHVDTGGTLLGLKLKLPVILAPIGSLQDFAPEG